MQDALLVLATFIAFAVFFAVAMVSKRHRSMAVAGMIGMAVLPVLVIGEFLLLWIFTT